MRRSPAIGAALLLLACTRVPGGDGGVPDPSPPEASDDARPAPQPDDAGPATPQDPPRVLTDPGSGVVVVWAGAAIDAAVAGAELVVLEPDGRHLGAIDWRDGEARWRIELAASEAARLHGLGDRVLVHDRDEAVVVEAERGRVLGRHEAPVDGHWPHAHAVARRRGACAWAGPCGIQAFDCATGAPRGPYLASPEVHLYGSSDDPSEHSTSCSPTPRLLGGHDDMVVVLADLPRTDDAGRPAGSVPSLAGLDARGEVGWQQALRSASAPAQMTDDGTCWVLDEEPPQLLAYDCATGSLRWDRPLGSGRLEAHTVGDAVVVARQQKGRWRLSAYATADGRAVWSTRLARRQEPVLPEPPIAGAHTTGNRRVYALIDPVEGTVAGELVAGRDEQLWRDPGGGFVLIGRELRELDAEGRLTRQRPFTGGRVHTVLADHLLATEGGAIEIYDRDQLRERARIEGRMSIEAATGLPSDRLLLQRHGDDGVALVLGLESHERGVGRR